MASAAHPTESIIDELQTTTGASPAGFMPGSRQEHGGIVVYGAKLLDAYCEARVPRITVVTGKAFGGACIVMSSNHVGADVNLAWRGAQISVLGAEGDGTAGERLGRSGRDTQPVCGLQKNGEQQ